MNFFFCIDGIESTTITTEGRNFFLFFWKTLLKGTAANIVYNLKTDNSTLGIITDLDGGQLLSD